QLLFRLLQILLIAVPDSHRAGNPPRRIGPGSGAARLSACSTQHIGYDVGHAPVLVLVRGNVPQPLGEESCYVHVEGRSSGEHLCIAGPAESLVALWTIGGYVHKVAFLSPDDVVLKLIDELA